MKRIPIEVPEGVELPTTEKRLSFTEWLKATKFESYIRRKVNDNEVIEYLEKSLNRDVSEYHAYLNNLPEEKASVIEVCALYKDEDYDFSFLPHYQIEKIVYNGRCSKDGDLFTIHEGMGPNGKVITHAQGTLNGLFIEIPE